MVDNLTPGQRLRLVEGRDPELTPGQRLEFIPISGGGGGVSLPGIKRESEAILATQKARAIQTKKIAREQAARKEATRKRIEEREIARQERIEAGQIAGQIETETIGTQIEPEKEAPGFRIGLSEREKQLSTREVIKGRFKEVGTGVLAAGGMLAEGLIGLAGSLGVQKIEFDEEGKRIDKRFRFSEESVIGQARDEPSGTGKVLGQALVFAPLVGGAIAGFGGAVGQQGLKTATLEAAAVFTPLSIPTQTFGALATAQAARGLKFDVVSLRQTTGDVTKRLVFGKGRGVEDVSLISRQVSQEIGGQKISSAVTDIVAPQTRFQLGKFTEGLSAVRTESISGELGGGRVTRGARRRDLDFSQVLEGVTGAGARVTTRTKARLDVLEGGVPELLFEPAAAFGKPRTTGAVTRGGEDAFDIFGAGRGRQILQIGREGGKVKVRVDEFNIRGVEFDISKLGARDQFGIRARGKGLGGRPPKDTGLEVSAKQLSASISDIAPKTTSFNGKQAARITTGPQGIFGAPSQFTEGGASLLLPGAKQRDIFIVDLGVSIDTALSVDLVSRQRPALKPRGRIRQRPALDVRLDVGTDVITETITRQIPRQKTRQKLKPAEELIGEGGFGGFAIPRAGAIPPILGLPLPPLLFPAFPSGRRKVKGRRPKEAIAPSLTGLALFDLGDITGAPLELSGRGGRSPFDIRFVPEDLAGKRSPGLGLGIFPTQTTKKKKNK